KSSLPGSDGAAGGGDSQAMAAAASPGDGSAVHLSSSSTGVEQPALLPITTAASVSSLAPSSTAVSSSSSRGGTGISPAAAAANTPTSKPIAPPPPAINGQPPQQPPTSILLPPYPSPYPASSSSEDDVTPSTEDDHQPPSSSSSSSSSSGGPPLVDVVFIHGIRGGPFITWRKAGVMTRGSAASHMERSDCWPSTWLAREFPRARLLSVEYLAPVSAWEGESLPLEDNVSRVMGQLAAAGVGTGQRPVVFVAHSMGGLLVKEMMARSASQAEQGDPHARLAPSTCGIVFYGTPHFGNTMAAMGWRLRHLPGAHPAPSLARLTPGPHLLALNDQLRALHDSRAGDLRVVSLLEGQPTQLSGVIPRILIVEPQSAYPGFGAAMLLPGNDHIDVCKPAGRGAPAYRVLRDVVRHAMMRAAEAEEEAGR
ncbi:hypothetical protein Agub_g11249, partial [Astrephomene gubernaculifera]